MANYLSPSYNPLTKSDSAQTAFSQEDSLSVVQVQDSSANADRGVTAGTGVTNDSPRDEPVGYKRGLQKMQFTGRLALTKESARFELPMDVWTLEELSPQEYLLRYCFPTPHRKMILDKLFMRNKDGKTGKLHYTDLQKALGEFLVQTANKDHIAEVFHLLQIGKEIRCERKLWHGIASFAERLLLPIYSKVDLGDGRRHKEKLECADFECLKWKLQGVNVNKPMMAVLDKLMGPS